MGPTLSFDEIQLLPIEQHAHTTGGVAVKDRVTTGPVRSNSGRTGVGTKGRPERTVDRSIARRCIPNTRRSVFFIPGPK